MGAIISIEAVIIFGVALLGLLRSMDSGYLYYYNNSIYFTINQQIHPDQTNIGTLTQSFGGGYWCAGIGAIMGLIGAVIMALYVDERIAEMAKGKKAALARIEELKGNPSKQGEMAARVTKEKDVHTPLGSDLG